MIKRKECTEEGCSSPRWSKGLCQMHHRLAFLEKYQIKSRPNKAAHGTKSVGGSKCTLIKRKSRISTVSKSMTKKLAEYRVVRDEYMREHPICEHPDCSRPATDLHHAAGRQGNNLIDVGKFRALCRDCHRWVEENPVAAKGLGLSLDRL